VQYAGNALLSSLTSQRFVAAKIGFVL